MQTDEMLDEHVQENTQLKPIPNELVAHTDHAYYRSQLFHFDSGVNPLISAADPVLTVATKLMANHHTPDTDNLHADLIHEMNAFESNANNHQYPPQIILAARYILCTFIDETITNSHWGKKIDWQSQSLLQRFHQEASGRVRFFVILERSSEDVHSNIDLLELIYLCLRLGYEGKYQQREKGLEDLIKVTDNLYGLIREHRGNFSKKLLIEDKGSTSFTYHDKLPSLNLLLALLILLAIVIRVDLTGLVKADIATMNDNLTSIETGTQS